MSREGRQLLLCGGCGIQLFHLMTALCVLLRHPLLVPRPSQKEAWDRLKKDSFCLKIFGDPTFLQLVLDQAPSTLVRQLVFLGLDALVEAARFLLTEEARATSAAADGTEAGVRTLLL